MKDQIRDNTTSIADNAELIQHINDLIAIYGPMFVLVGILIGFIIGLLIWAWRRLENTQAKLEAVFTLHVKENDKLHNKLFEQIRAVGDKYAELHEAYEKIKIYHKNQHDEDIV